MIFVQMIFVKNWMLLDRYPLCLDLKILWLFVRKMCLVCKMCGFIFSLWILYLQILRNEEGKKLGLKVNEKSSVQKENDVKMSDAEVRKQPN